METKIDISKNINLFAIIAAIWLFFCSIFIIRAVAEGRFYEALSNGEPVSGLLGQKIANIENTIKANEVMEKQDYESALTLITGTKSEDYYNRWTIQTILAYKNALKSNISWLESAQWYITQAQQNFDIANKLWVPQKIKRAIIDNQQTIQSLSSVIDIKTCYGIGSSIISNLNSINTIITAIKNTLQQEEEYLSRRANNIDEKCYEKLSYIVDTSKEQVGSLEKQMIDNTQDYKSEFSEKIEDPYICISTPYENMLPSMIKGAQGLSQYQELHRNTVEALKNNDQKKINDLCNQTKNDAQISQQIEDTVQELLGKLDDNSLDKQQQQRSSDEVKYKNFFDKNEKKVLRDIQNINQSRINTILNIRGKGNYDTEHYLDSLFNQFYGNTGDFIDLHK